MSVNITWDRTKRDGLRKAYEAALAAGKDVFQFEGHDILVSYAKYLLEYLDGMLGK
jgi:hypothetical protein